jgi:hypothetical protein
VRRLLGKLEHNGHSSQGLGKAPGSGGLLPDAAKLQRQGFILQARRLASDAKLHDYEAGSIERAVAIRREDQLTRPFVLRENAARQPSDDCEALGVDVKQDELVDRKALTVRVKTLDELRRVGAAASDDRDLHTHVGASYAKMDWNC